MKIALIGYGKMGKAIEEIAVSRGHSITLRLTIADDVLKSDFSTSDIAVEFTRPDSVLEHIDFCIEKHIPIVVGTTGWNDSVLEVTDKIKSSNGALLHASNFSVGVNIFFEINRLLARLMNNQPGYDAQIEEIHHLEKLDSPSGTAITIANGLISENKNFSTWKSIEMDIEEESLAAINNLKEDDLPIICFREPNIPGTHIVTYLSEVDTISISHEAHSRQGFALGAVLAAEFLQGKQGVFTMHDVLKQSI
jgi:4-hydroxy-tetrahydrodipicolinate reductase